MPQSSKTASRCSGMYVLLLALFLANCTLFSFAQESPSPEPTPTTTSSKPENPTEPISAPPSGATDEQLRLAQQQGKADTAILDWILANSGPVKGDTHAGGLRVAFTVTPSEGWWDKAAEDKLAWHDAPDDNLHLRIFVLDLADGRLVPGLNIRATLIDANGNEQSIPVDYGWYPLMNAYGGNVPLPADSAYTLRVAIEGPLPHHDLPAGERRETTTVAEFPPVEIIQEAVSELPLATSSAFANEADLLKPANAALRNALTALWRQSISGAEKASGDYFVGYALDYNGLALQVAGAKLRLKNLIEFTGKDSVRLELLVRDSRTGRLIPGLKPQASLIATDGKTYGSGDLSLAWHPWLNQYGRNDRIPRKGSYTLRVHFAAPGFRRWGHQSERFAAPADVEFDKVSLKPEKKD